MYRELSSNKGSRYYFSFPKLAFSKPKITRTDGGSISLNFNNIVTSSVFYEIAVSYFIKNVSRT